MLKIAYSEIYKYRLPEGHRFPMLKYELIPEQLLYEGTVNEDNFFHPGQLSRKQLLSTHTSEYLDKLDTLSLSRKEERNIGFPVRQDLVERGKYISHGTYECASIALKTGISMNIAGGTHHAFADKGEGFCLYNDMALASKLIRKEKKVDQILFVDLDVHQGNGNAAIFKDEPKVFTFSMHGEKNYPLRKETSDLDIGLPDKIEDKNYLRLLTETLDKLMMKVQPNLIFFQAGVDVLATDKLGRLGLTMEGCKERDRIVMRMALRDQVPLVIVMGGGYSEKMTDLVTAHSNTFRSAQEIYF